MAKMNPNQILLSLIYKFNIKDSESLRERVINEFSKNSFDVKLYFEVLARIETIDFKNIK